MIHNDPFKTPPQSPREKLSNTEMIRKLDEELHQKRKEAARIGREQMIHELVISMIKDMDVNEH